LNEVSALFGPNFVHFNALDGDTSNLFKCTWYCLTLMTPTRPYSAKPSGHDPGRPGKRRLSVTNVPGDAKETCTFTDMTRIPRATLRVCLVNESELRRISDGKLRPPSWGFFNDRHAERFRMVQDFARNFQKQLVRTSADPRTIEQRNPFTSEKVSNNNLPESKPDGGLMKRVQSVPNMGVAASMSRNRSSPKDMSLGGSFLQSSGNLSSEGKTTQDEKWDQNAAEEDAGANASSENNCFLRLHVPHFLGFKESSSRQGSSSVDLTIQAPPASLNFGPKTPELSPASPGTVRRTGSLGNGLSASRSTIH